jgi:hypothetical protein
MEAGSLRPHHLVKWLEERGARFAVLRPDRYVFGVASEAGKAAAAR